MDPTALVTSAVSGGGELLKALDDEKVQVTTAGWFYDSLEGVWRLLLAMPSVESQGRAVGYEAVQRVLAKIAKREPAPAVPALNQIVVTSNKDPLVQTIRKAIRTGEKDVSAIRFTRNVIENMFIADALIYRSS